MKKVSFVLKIISAILLVGTILICIPLTIPRFFGCDIYAVISGSMEPAIPTGSLVLVKEEEDASIEVDDVIAYYSDSDNGAIITHRVVDNQVISGQFITKGDANPSNDPTPVDYERYIGKVIFSVKYLGYIASFLDQTAGKIAVVSIVLIAVLLNILGDTLIGKRKETESK